MVEILLAEAIARRERIEQEHKAKAQADGDA
jgi:hypothetical protein